MAKHNQLELSWIEKLGQWRKRKFVNGKRKDFYLCTGSGRDDLDSYRRALANWRTIEAQLDHDDEKQRLTQRLEDLRLEERLSGTPQKRRLKRHEISDLRRGFDLDEARERTRARASVQTAIAQGNWVQAAESVQAVAQEDRRRARLTFHVLVERWLSEQRRRYDHGQAVPDAPRQDRISGHCLISYQQSAQHIRRVLGEEVVPDDAARLGHLILRFRNEQQALVAAGQAQKSTFNSRIKALRHLVGWASRTYDPQRGRYHLEHLPRDLAKLCSKYPLTSSARALDLDTLHRVWDGAYPPLRAYIALGLNCGYYAVDIAHLRREHLRDGYLVADRHKTGVPSRYKLWPLTQEMLRRTMNGRDGYAFAARDGGLLWRVDPRANKTGRRWCQIDNDLQACKKRLKVRGVSFSMFRDTSSTHIESIDRSLTDLFDAHKDQRMARFYIDRERLDLDRLYAKLDAAVDQLASVYGLEC